MELKSLIQQNRDRDALRVYLSLLAENHKSATTSNKELQVLLFGVIAGAYGKRLLDPLDKVPSLLKSIVRICEMIHKFLKVNLVICGEI
jgi:hypothetical protein